MLELFEKLAEIFLINDAVKSYHEKVVLKTLQLELFSMTYSLLYIKLPELSEDARAVLKFVKWKRNIKIKQYDMQVQMIKSCNLLQT